MSLAAPYQEHYYIADGEIVTFPFGDFFQALSQNYVKCVIYFSDGTNCIPSFTVDMENQQITIVTLTKPDGTVLTVPPAGSVVRVYRETPEQQNVTASQLQNYTAKQLEKIFDSMVAMQQETSYSDLHKNIRLTEPQRDISIEPLTEEKDQALLYWDEESRQIKATEYGQDEVIEQIERANTVADEAKTIAGKARDDLRDHEMDKGNPHETSMAKLTDTEIVDPERFQFLSFDGTKWKNVNYSATYTWGGIGGDITDQTDLFNTFVKKTGDTVSGMYKHSYGSRARYLSANNTNKYMDVYMNDDIFTLYYHYTNSSTATLSMRSYVDGHFNIYPNSDKGGTIGFPSRRFEKIYTTHLCGSTNGNNYLIVPDVGHSDTIATKSQVDLAANSGSQLYTTGVWYAKMYAATVVPTGAEYDGRKYADFSQTDSGGNPVIKIYTGASGAWTLTDTIIPPATYNGYMTITSKIWDIAEQSGQQGGQVLWDYTHKTFTPYPKIVSFESIEIIGESTVEIPANPVQQQIVNKKYVDDAVIQRSKKSPDVVCYEYSRAYFTDNGDAVVRSSADINIPGGLCFGWDVHEIVICFTTASASTANGTILSGTGWNKLTLRTDESGHLKIVNPITDPVTWSTYVGTTVLQPSTKYYVKITCTHTAETDVVLLYLSTDGVNYTLEQNTNPDYHDFSYVDYGSYATYYIGAVNASDSKTGIIHLSECYIKDAKNMLTWTGLGEAGLHQRVAKGHEVIEFQAPTAQNNYTWYRKYADGWVEQGGITGAVNGVGATASVTLPVTMSNAYYSVYVTITRPSNPDFRDQFLVAGNRSTTGFTVYSNWAGSANGSVDNLAQWEVKGMYND